MRATARMSVAARTHWRSGGSSNGGHVTEFRVQLVEICLPTCAHLLRSGTYAWPGGDHRLQLA